MSRPTEAARTARAEELIEKEQRRQQRNKKKRKRKRKPKLSSDTGTVVRLYDGDNRGGDGDNSGESDALESKDDEGKNEIE
jgi:hypothetical protein